MMALEQQIEHFRIRTGLSGSETAKSLDYENMLFSLYTIIDNPRKALQIARETIQRHLELVKLAEIYKFKEQVQKKEK